jgi:nitrogen regulatory protein PII-like uncharacterized protein
MITMRRLDDLPTAKYFESFALNSATETKISVITDISSNQYVVIMTIFYREKIIESMEIGRLAAFLVTNRAVPDRDKEK